MTEPPDSFSISKITIVVTIVALGLLSWHFSGSRFDPPRFVSDETSPPAKPDSAAVRQLSERLDSKVLSGEQSEDGGNGAQPNLDTEADRQTAEALNQPPQFPKQSKNTQLSLTGTIRIGDRDERALIRRRKEAKGGIWLSIGEEFLGWELRGVELDSATIKAGGKKVELRLY